MTDGVLFHPVYGNVSVTPASDAERARYVADGWGETRAGQPEPEPEPEPEPVRETPKRGRPVKATASTLKDED